MYVCISAGHSYTILHVYSTDRIGFLGKATGIRKPWVLAKAEGKFKNKRVAIQWHVALGSVKDIIWKKSGKTQMLIKESLGAFFDFAFWKAMGILISQSTEQKLVGESQEEASTEKSLCWDRGRSVILSI